ncbi:hypothetical protein OPIT5_09170 [Opitutaceae bacterium TAV5]|nr:hypothetical protein OPIT5_09170 [Opitutaceae bacterium TAV5]
MLIYLVHGKRFYGKEPVAPHRKHFWEFQVVVRGSIGLVLPEGPAPLKKNTLWLFPPEHLHGWTGKGHESATVLVFHFQYVPQLLEGLVKPGGHLEIPLTPRQARRLVKLAEEAEPYWRHFAPGMVMCYEHVLSELGMLVWEAHPDSRYGIPAHSARKKVSDAMKWFASHMAENPSLERTAQSVGVSPAHLRRLFHEILRSSPKQTFDQMRFQCAIQLMGDPMVKLSTVGEACGFGSASSFSRAFKTKFGCSPEKWRS